MAKLGTTEHPAVVRLATMARAAAAMALAEEMGWQAMVGVEDDKPEDLTDFEYLWAESHPRPKIGRNDPCPCGSGKKHKACCVKLPSAVVRLLEERLGPDGLEGASGVTGPGRDCTRRR